MTEDRSVFRHERASRRVVTARRVLRSLVSVSITAWLPWKATAAAH